MSLIEIKNLTKDYGNNRGIFDISFNIEKGEVFGFLGPNGAGKTTTIRNIMGFLKPDKGSVTVNNLDSWDDSSEIKKYIAYVPGEIAFPDFPSGISFLKSQAEFVGLKDFTYADELIKKLQLDPRANPRKMSKGMKQKTAVICAFMSNRDIIILDEPTTGLDPLMRVAFLDIIEKEKKKGKTILMSSHMFEELESTCDRVAMIKDGKIVDIVDIFNIKNRTVKDYKIEFTNKESFDKFKKLDYNITRIQEKYKQVTINIELKNLTSLFNDLSKLDVKFISEVKYNLEKYFKEKIYQNGEGDTK